jgi:hypothetical protein
LRWPTLPGASESTIWIERTYLDQFEVGTVTPTPALVALGTERNYYTFHVREQSAAAGASFRLTAKRSGLFAGAAALDGGAPIAIEQFVFP